MFAINLADGKGRLRRTVAETLCTHYESPHSLGMPAELLDEYEEIPGMDLNGFLVDERAIS